MEDRTEQSVREEVECYRKEAQWANERLERTRRHLTEVLDIVSEMLPKFGTVLREYVKMKEELL